MANILYLVHRIPFPPNKGDKVRSYNLLTHLAAFHRVYLGAFIDDEEDERYAPALEDVCVDSRFVRLVRRKTASHLFKGFITESALTIAYYWHEALSNWVRSLLDCRLVDCAVVFSSSMAQYVEKSDLPLLVDFVDVDSLKWKQYSENHFWPLAWIYRREAKLLGQYEKWLALHASSSFFVTANEREMFCSQAPDCASRVKVLGNGVDTGFFSPQSGQSSPFPEDRQSIVVFTGAMDYLPNIDAVCWFAQEVLPILRQKGTDILFYIVGRSPTAAVKRLASESVVVTGTVTDVRPYLQFARVVVAPLRIARGVQNKILEALSMGCPVVAASACVRSLGSGFEQIVVSAGTATEFARGVEVFLDSPSLAKTAGVQGREQVVTHYSWPAHMAAIDAPLNEALVAT